MIDLIKKPNNWYNELPEPKRFLILILLVFSIIVVGNILSDHVSPIFKVIPNFIFMILILYRISYNVILKKEYLQKEKERLKIIAANEKLCIGNELIAREDVPDLVEPVGIRFLKDKKYTVVNIREKAVDVRDEYGDIDTFSINVISKGYNYLWDWFDNV